MTCDDALNLLSARLDGELDVADRDRFEAHLIGCADCRAAAEGFTAHDASLRHAMSGRRQVASAIADRVALEFNAVAAAPSRRLGRIGWLIPLASAAAGFLIACLWLQPWNHSDIADSRTLIPTPKFAASKPVAQLALATGEVFLCPPATETWSAMPTGGSVQPGDRVRTGPAVRCELKTADGSEVRLNGSTEVCFRTPRTFELAGGQVWSTVAKAAEPFEARTTDATFTALGTQFDLSCKPGQAVLTVVEGSVRAKGATGEAVMHGGEAMTIADGRLGDKTAVHNLAVATRWVNEILVMKGRDNPELARRIDDLFAEIGQQKMSYLYEEEIRALGDHCVIPLSRYIESDRSRANPAKRADAARIVADVAPPWAIPELIRLLEDDSGEVRSYAATALQRLTGQTLGRGPEQWRTDSQFNCLPVAREWRSWWDQNKTRYPGADASPLDSRQEPPVAKEPRPLMKG